MSDSLAAYVLFLVRASGIDGSRLHMHEEKTSLWICICQQTKVILINRL